MKRFAMVIALLLVAGFAFGADVDGKWTTEIPGQDGAAKDRLYLQGRWKHPYRNDNISGREGNRY